MCHVGIQNLTSELTKPMKKTKLKSETPKPRKRQKCVRIYSYWKTPIFGHIFDVFSAWVYLIWISSFALAQLAHWSNFEYPHDTFPRNFFFNPIKGFSDFRGSDWKPKSQKIIFLTMFPCYWYIEPKNFHRIQIIGAFFRFSPRPITYITMIITVCRKCFVKIKKLKN